MAKNKRILIDTLGVSHEAFARNGSSAEQNKFIWNNNVRRIEKLQLKDERKVHKNNSLKSRYSKIDFKEWKKYVLSAKIKVKNADLKVRKYLYKKGAITLNILDGDIDEVYSDISVKKSHIEFLSETVKILNKIEVAQIKITDIKFMKAKNIPESTSRTEMINAVKKELLEFKNILNSYIYEFNTKWLSVRDGEAVNDPIKNGFEDFNNLFENYKNAKAGLKSTAKEAAKSYEMSVKTGHPLFDLKANIKKDVFRLETAKAQLEYFSALSKYDWEFKFKFDVAIEIIETIPKVIEAKRNNAKQFLKIIQSVKLEKKRESSKQKIQIIKSNILGAKEQARESLKNESAKLKMSGAAKNGFKTKKAEIRHNLKSKIRELKLEDKFFELKSEMAFLKADLYQKINYETKILNSNIQEIRKKTPIEISLIRYWAIIISGIIIPGLDSLINKQWTKGVLKLLGTLFFAFILAWCFGAFPSSQGNGLMGLGTFGAENGKLIGSNDSRFFLVTGTIAIIMLVVVIFYWLISSLNTINVANLARAGIRFSNWRDQKRLLKTIGLPYLLSAPALIFILFIVVLPLLATLLLSFTNFNQRVYIPETDKFVVLNGVSHPFAWVGWQQYNYITRVVGDDFTKVLSWTVIWTVFATFLTMFLGTFLALLVNQNRIKGKTFFRVIYILPWAIPAFLTILFFSIFFAESGTFNNTIGKGMFGESIDWKNSVNHQKALLIFIQGWLGQSYMFLLVTGMIQSIPKSLYEAARVDGSKPGQQFRTITMPIIVMQIAPLLIGQFTFNFNNFGIIYLFNGGGPKLSGSAGETDIFLSWVFRLVNNGVSAKPGAGAALSLLVSIFVVTPSAFLFFRSKSFRGGNF